LLPELQFHAHDRLKLSLALLAGLAAAVAITRFGHASHEHESEQPVAKVSLDINAQSTSLARGASVTSRLASASEQPAGGMVYRRIRVRRRRRARATADDGGGKRALDA